MDMPDVLKQFPFDAGLGSVLFWIGIFLVSWMVCHLMAENGTEVSFFGIKYHKKWREDKLTPFLVIAVLIICVSFLILVFVSKYIREPDSSTLSEIYEGGLCYTSDERGWENYPLQEIYNDLNPGKKFDPTKDFSIIMIAMAYLDQYGQLDAVTAFAKDKIIQTSEDLSFDLTTLSFRFKNTDAIPREYLLQGIDGHLGYKNGTERYRPDTSDPNKFDFNPRNHPIFLIQLDVNISAQKYTMRAYNTSDTQKSISTVLEGAAFRAEAESAEINYMNIVAVHGYHHICIASVIQH